MRKPQCMERRATLSVRAMTHLEQLEHEGIRRLGSPKRGFRYVDASVQEVMGEEYSAKDFRTWAGTLICACALAKAKTRAKEALREGASAPQAKKVAKKTLVAAVRETAQHLGNTPAVAKASYIYPSVIAMFEKGRVVDKYFESVDELAAHESDRLHCAEKALLTLLENGTPANAPH